MANHVSSFVQQVRLVTLLGDQDSQLEFIQNSLAKNIELTYFTKKNSPTILKRRYVDYYKNNKLFKVEYINDRPIEENLSHQIVEFLERELPLYDVVLVGDYGHGFINNAIRRVLEEKSKFLSINVQSNSANMGYNYFTQYKKFNFITFNEEELRLPFNRRFDDVDQLFLEVHEQLMRTPMLLTAGKRGCTLAMNGKMIKSPAFVTTTKDVVGAGDAVFALTSLMASTSVDGELLPFIGNCAGAIAANIMGNKESISKEKVENFIADLYKIDIRQYLTSVNDTLNKMKIENIDAFVTLLLETYEKGGTVYVFGNGGSAATASHFCGDLIKGVSYGLEKRFRAICLNDNMPALMAIANDISYDDIFLEQLKNFLRSGDLVIGISGSGNSANVVKALQYAKEVGATTVAICGFKGGKIKDVCDLALHAEVNDMEVSEDIHHLILTHCVKRLITKKLNNNHVGEIYEKRIV